MSTGTANEPVVNGVLKIGIVVDDIAEAMRSYRELLGIDGWSVGVVDSQDGQGQFWVGADPVDLRASIAWIDLGGVEVELIQPMDETSEFGRFLERHGPGIHHVAFATSDYARACGSLEGRGAAEVLRADVLGTEFSMFDTAAALGFSVSFARPAG